METLLLAALGLAATGRSKPAMVIIVGSFAYASWFMHKSRSK